MKEAAELSTPTSDYQVICTKLFLSSGIHPKVKIIWEWFIFYLGSGCSSGRELIWVAFYSSRTRRHRFPSLLIFHHWCVPIVEPCFIQWILVNFTVFNTGWCLPWSDSCPCWLPNEATGYYSAHSKWQVLWIYLLDLLIPSLICRFEVGKKICLSISGHHPETWQVRDCGYHS